MLPVHLQRSAVAAIVDCPVRGQFTGSRSLKPVAPQLIWLFQESLSIFNGYIDLKSTYVSGTSINNEVTFTNPISTSLSGSGLIAEWKIMDGRTELDQVKIFLSTPPNSASAPAPIPLVGGALAFGWSRRLRRRVGKAAFTVRG